MFDDETSVQFYKRMVAAGWLPPEQVKAFQDALGTAETGEALIEVARNAHKAEQAAAAQPAPTLVITVEGGLVSAVCLDKPFAFADVIVIDYDTSGEGVQVEQHDGSYSEAYVSHPTPELLQIPLEQFYEDGDEDGDED